MKIEKCKLKIIIWALALVVAPLFIYFVYLTQIVDNQLMSDARIANKKIIDNSVNDINMPKVRPAVVAGAFYPAAVDKLSQEVEDFLQNVPIKNEKIPRIPRIILVPHAGYEYSGQTAAYGYKLLEGSNIRRVILLGSSHNYPISGMVSDDSDSWETPLGKVALDQELMGKMQISLDHEPFLPEHSLEVQLPFLQKVLKKDFKIIPILVNGINSVETRHTASLLERHIDENTVVIVSSDMSHYPSYENANKYDHETIETILTGDVNKFIEKIGQLERKNISNAATFMCARPAVELGMILAKGISANDIKLLAYNNSGDTTGDKSRVVGYGAIGFFGGESKKTDSQKLLQIARDSVESFIKNGAIPKFDADDQLLQKKSGVFVTLRNSGQLRGCIGLIESDQPLYKTIPQIAVAAAVDDPRFNRVTEEDLPKLEYEVSVLSPMKKIKDASEIKLGTHGVKVQKDGRSGVFLPQVAEETGWSKEEFLNRLCRDKAGLAEDCWKDPATEIYTFTAEVFSDAE